MSLTQKSQHQCCDETEANQHCPAPVLSVHKFAAVTTEILDSHSRHMYSNAAVALGGASRRNTLMGRNLHAAQLTWVNFFGMESAGSWSGPRAKASMPAGDIHAPLGVNQVDITPTDGDLLPGINDHNFYVIVNNFRSDVNHVNQSVYCDAPSDCCAQTLSQQSRPNEEHRKRQRAATEKKSSLGSKDFTLAHTSIFSYTSHITDGQVS